MSQTILVADDSPTIRKIVELTFSESEIRVETAGTGREAMDRLRSVSPDLVLADVVMPDMSGYDLCRSIKASEHPVPVVLLAGTFEPFDADLARECGADAHLVKPFESAVLREKVRRLLEPPVETEADAASDASPQPSVADEPVSAVEADRPDELRIDRPGSGADVSPELVAAVADAVVQRLSREVVREIASEVVPRLATELIRARIRELETEELEDEQPSSEGRSR
jgi:DNA-binding response OmpR family regulator